MGRLNSLFFVRRKQSSLKPGGERRPSPWKRFIPSIERLEDRTVPSTLEFSATLAPTAADYSQTLSVPRFDNEGGYRILDKVAVMVGTQLQTTISGSLTNDGDSNASYRAFVDGS